MNGKLIAVEGIDGAGKSTVVDALAEEFGLYKTAEPSHFWTGNQVRRALQEETPPFTDFFLFMADRHYHIEDFIKPRLEDGESVISDRFMDSTLAYQPVQLEGQPNMVKVGDWILDVMEPWMIEPDLVIYLDVPVLVGLERIGAPEDKYENADMLRDVKENYESVMDRLEERDPDGVVRIDAEQSKDAVRIDAIEAVNNFL